MELDCRWSALDDMIAWNQGLRTKAIQDPDSWAVVFAPVTLKSGKTYPYGFGWEIEAFGGQKRLHHAGDWQGFSAYISRYIGDNLAIIVFANLAYAETSQLVDGINPDFIYHSFLSGYGNFFL